MAGPSHNLFLDGSGGAIGEGMHDDQHFVNLNELELIGMPFNAPRDYAYSDNGMTPRTQDSLDRLLDNCQFNFCPLLQAKMTARLGASRKHGRISLALCHWPWISSNKLRKTWFELQYKPQGSRWFQAVAASSRQSSVQCISHQVHLPGFLSRLVFQAAAGVSLWDSSKGKHSVQPLLLWKLTGRGAISSAYRYKFEWAASNLKARVSTSTAVLLPELGGGIGHEGDELCSCGQMGVNVAVRKLSLRWEVTGQDGLQDDDIDQRGIWGSLWNPKAWCSKSILDTRMGL